MSAEQASRRRVYVLVLPTTGPSRHYIRMYPYDKKIPEVVTVVGAGAVHGRASVSQTPKQTNVAWVLRSPHARPALFVLSPARRESEKIVNFFFDFGAPGTYQQAYVAVTRVHTLVTRIIVSHARRTARNASARNALLLASTLTTTLCGSRMSLLLALLLALSSCTTANPSLFRPQTSKRPTSPTLHHSYHLSAASPAQP